MVRIVNQQQNQDVDFVEKMAQNEMTRAISAKEQQAADLRNFLAQENNRNPRLRRFQKRQEEDEKIQRTILGSNSYLGSRPNERNLQAQPPPEPRQTNWRQVAETQTSPPRQNFQLNEPGPAQFYRNSYGARPAVDDFTDYNSYPQRMPPPKRFYYDDEPGPQYYPPRPPAQTNYSRSPRYGQYEQGPPNFQTEYYQAPRNPGYNYGRNAYMPPETGYFNPAPPQESQQQPLNPKRGSQAGENDLFSKLGSNHQIKTEKNSYAEDLRRQMQEKEARKLAEKQQQRLPILPPSNQSSVETANFGYAPAQYQNSSALNSPYGNPSPFQYQQPARMPPPQQTFQQQPYQQQPYQQMQSPASYSANTGMNAIGAGSPTQADKQGRQAQYMAELQAQAELKKQQKQYEKQQERIYDMKKEEEMRNYNQFGKGGSGAALYDTEGNIVTNTKRLAKQREAEMELGSPTSARPSQQQQFASPLGTNPLNGLLSDLKITSNLPSPAGVGTSAIHTASAAKASSMGFGSGLPSWQADEVEKRQNKQLQYQAELQKQIEAQKLAKALESQKLKQEEEREMQQIQQDIDLQKQRYDAEQLRVGKADQLPVNKGSAHPDPFEPSSNNGLATLPQTGQNLVADTKAAKSRNLHERQAKAEEAYLQAKAEAEEFKKQQRLARAGRGKATAASGEDSGPPYSYNPPAARAPSPPIPTLRNNALKSGGDVSLDSPSAAKVRHSPPITPSRGANAFEDYAKPQQSMRKAPSTYAESGNIAQSSLRNNRSHDSLRSTDSNRQTTLQILDQLATIQKDLEMEKIKVQNELKKPLLPNPPAITKVASQTFTQPPAFTYTHNMSGITPKNDVAVIPSGASEGAAVIATRTVDKSVEGGKLGGGFSLPFFEQPITGNSPQFSKPSFGLGYEKLLSATEQHEQYLSSQRRILDEQERELGKLRRQVQLASATVEQNLPFELASKPSGVNLDANTNSAALFPTFSGAIRNSDVVDIAPNVVQLTNPTIHRANSNSSLFNMIKPMAQLQLQSVLPISSNEPFPLLSLDPQLSLLNTGEEKQILSETSIVPI